MKVIELLEGDVVPIRQYELAGRPMKPIYHNGRPKPDVVDLEDLKFFEPNKWSDITFKPYMLNLLDVKRLEKERGRPFKRLSAQYIYGSNKKNARGPMKQGKFQNKPFDSMFIITFDDGAEYLVKSPSHSKYVQGWIGIDK